MHDIRIYLKAGAALAAMGTVSFIVFSSITGFNSKPRAPVAERQLAAGGGPDYIHGSDPVVPIEGAVVFVPSAFGATPFAASYRIHEDVGGERGRSYNNGLDVEGDLRHIDVDGVWKSPTFTRASRQLPPQPWKPVPIDFAPDAARCPAGMPEIAVVGGVRFGAVPRPSAGVPVSLSMGERIIGCQHLGQVLPLSQPGPLVSESIVAGEVTHRGRPALLLEISGTGHGWSGVESFAGYALLDRATGWLVFSAVEGHLADPAAHGGYVATLRETVRVDLP